MSARVLVVDDVAPNVKLLAAKLSAEYYEVVTAMNGPDALERARTHALDIVLLDVMMPGMDGFEVCRRLKSDPATLHVPVVMVTALSDAADRVRGLEAGADDFLTKPVNDVALFARVKSLVRLKATFDQWRLRETTSSQFGMLQSIHSPRAQPCDNARVLLVEDLDIDRDRVTQALREDRHELRATCTGSEAIAAALADPFDLAIISLDLEREDGLRIVSQLRAREATRQMPILMLGHDGDLPKIAKGLSELGANDYVLRPIDRNEVLARVRSQIRRKRYQDRLQSNYENNLSMALVDHLTGLHNDRYLDAHLMRLMEAVAQTRKPFAVLMFDIDHFKSVNDTWGHPVGDEVLKDFGRRLTRNLRSVDLAARLHGEEFVVLLPDTERDEAMAVADRLRHTICDEPFGILEGAKAIPVSTSVGVAVVEPMVDRVCDVFRRADDALLLAKRGGRNRVVFQDWQPAAQPLALAGVA